MPFIIDSQDGRCTCCIPSCIMLRVIITEGNVQKLILPPGLESVQDLKNQVKERFELKGEFSLQFVDPDFDNFMSLSSLKDIKDRGTIKVVPLSIPDSDSDTDIDTVFDPLSNSSLLHRPRRCRKHHPCLLL
ncbi:uncharacterized protein [Asterias amurensis]|uniref:uncharacterized protein n=1 Tax=Asterias amurensis TaxID=7602 RepID=UPI003AB52370